MKAVVRDDLGEHGTGVAGSPGRAGSSPQRRQRALRPLSKGFKGVVLAFGGGRAKWGRNVPRGSDVPDLGPDHLLSTPGPGPPKV